MLGLTYLEARLDGAVTDFVAARARGRRLQSIDGAGQPVARGGLERACGIPIESDVAEVAELLGSGRRVISSDTVPFSLWCAARHLNDFEEAMWTTVSGLGDRDTTCAIVGGVVALAVGEAGIPKRFVDAREPLGSRLDYLERDAIATSLGRR